MNHSALAPSIPLKKSYSSLKALPASKKTAWKKLAVSTSEEVRFIPFEDIIYCMATSNYTTIFTRPGKSYLCCKTLKDIESKLPDDAFFRIHNSYLVNLDSITCLKKNTSEIEIENKLLLPVSQTKKAALYKLLDA